MVEMFGFRKPTPRMISYSENQKMFRYSGSRPVTSSF